MRAGDARDCFSAAAEGFVAAVSAVGEDDWGRPGLGVWNVRDLVGHTSRSLTTIESYLATPADEIVIHDPLDYLLALRGPALDSAAIVQRGRAAGAALGTDPAAAVRSLAGRVTSLVATTPDAALLTTALGGATLGAYLPTRTFELTVHTLDLVGALGIESPPVLAGPISACLQLAAAAIAAAPGPGEGRGTDAAAVLLALTGRCGLPAGFSIF